VWRYFPVILFVGGYAMASNMRMPKLGLMRSKSATAFVFANVFLGYVFGFARLFPEYMIWPPTAWLVVFLIWGKLSPAARAMTPPPLFPSVDPPIGQEPIRPEDDLLPEHADEPLDEPPGASGEDLSGAAVDSSKTR
jgi:CDP-diacylglycerol--serine O-phosphatidyltransferase